MDPIKELQKLTILKPAPTQRKLATSKPENKAKRNQVVSAQLKTIVIIWGIIMLALIITLITL